MISHHMLSNDQHIVVTSHTEVHNRSEQLRRILEKTDQALETFDIILTSDYLTQEFKDRVFDYEKIRKLFDRLIRYDESNTIVEEANKQTIAREMIRLGYSYFQMRYKETRYLQKQIENINELLDVLDFLSQAKQEENDAMELYRVRGRAKYPTVSQPDGQHWIGECMYCFRYSLGVNKSEKDAIKNIQHEKACMYNKAIKKFSSRNHKDMINFQYIRVIPPKNK